MELGRLPIIHKINLNAFKYWFCILSSAQDSLLYKIYKNSEQLSTLGIKSWAHNIKLLLHKLRLSNFWSKILTDITNGTFNITNVV